VACKDCPRAADPFRDSSPQASEHLRRPAARPGVGIILQGRSVLNSPTTTHTMSLAPTFSRRPGCMEQSRFSPLDVERELRRIGVDPVRLRGLATRGISSGDFIGWLRTIPGGIGHDAFMVRLQATADAGGPHPPGPGEAPAPGVASYRDPAIEERKALWEELERVVPRSTWAKGSEGFGFDPPHGVAHALAVLRALPDAAGPAAFFRALRDTPPLEEQAGGGPGA